MANRSHGEAAGRNRKPTKEYKTWCGIKGRCHNPKSKDWHNYGGRGILVCDRWLNDYAAFLADVGRAPLGMSLEREDNNKGYEPGNCCWATPGVQNRNRRAFVPARKMREVLKGLGYL